MDQFIARENIKHFRDLLWSESDPAVRARLRKLLIEEEDKLGASLEVLANLDRHIADGKARIERQRALIVAMERNGDNGLPQARGLLDGMIEGQALHVMYRQKVSSAVELSSL